MVEPSGRILRAVVSVLVALRASAWAFPRPSAKASAKLAKRRVTNRINVINPLKILGLLSATSPKSSGLMVTKAVTIVPIQTKNITGFLMAMRGSSLTKACLIALEYNPFVFAFGVCLLSDLNKRFFNTNFSLLLI